ncbi:MAG TPA: cupredoxin family copper-binding protein [Thermomicrobiales bacterium]|nr:cupredoxin family copper-binding protein [Thermomicrobiales bacterium]
MRLHARAQLTMRSFSVAAAIALVLMIGLVLPALAAPRHQPAVAAADLAPTIDLSITNYAFQPGTLTVFPGTTVRWTNHDNVSHDVTSNPTDPVAPLQSPTLGQGATYSYTFTQPGDYHYFCSIHPFMLGEIQVVGAMNFPATGFSVDGPFLAYWQSHGLDFGDPGVSYQESLALFGYPISDKRMETLEDDKQYLVQYFERARLEYHPESADPQYQVLLGQFGRRIHPADPAAQQQPGAMYFQETGHNLSGTFQQYWQQNGGLPIFGFPITEPFQEQLSDGHTYTVQYFERARFELHPENQPPYNVELGQFGRQVLEGH